MKMSNNLTIATNEDGWSDAAAEAAERVIKGTLLKFADWNWSRGKESVPVEIGTTLVALNTAAGWVKWRDDKPVEYKMREPKRRLPDREELGDLNEDDWQAGKDGKPKDPWQSTRFVYLVDPVTAEAFTFSTSSWGGRSAVSDLADQIQRIRCAQPGAVPVVELQAAPMLTKFGKKSKPWLKVVDWRFPSAPAPAEPEPPLLPSSNGAAAKAIDDKVPY
jgi:hypothetical protein